MFLQFLTFISSQQGLSVRLNDLTIPTKLDLFRQNTFLSNFYEKENSRSIVPFHHTSTFAHVLLKDLIYLHWNGKCLRKRSISSPGVKWRQLQVLITAMTLCTATTQLPINTERKRKEEGNKSWHKYCGSKKIRETWKWEATLEERHHKQIGIQVTFSKTGRDLDVLITLILMLFIMADTNLQGNVSWHLLGQSFSPDMKWK